MLGTRHTPDYIRECFNYDPDTGCLEWRERPEEHFRTPKAHKAWIGRNVGWEVGCVRTRHGSEVRDVKIDGVRYYAHRIIWAWVNGEWPKHRVDHIDRNSLNNRIANLHDVTLAEQTAHRKPLRAADLELRRRSIKDAYDYRHGLTDGW